MIASTCRRHAAPSTSASSHASSLPGSGVAHGGFVASMPGIVLEVRVGVGDRVVAGQTLVVLEAMKMEHRMTAHADGIVAEVHVVQGQQVANGAVLLVIDDETDKEKLTDG